MNNKQGHKQEVLVNITNTKAAESLLLSPQISKLILLTEILYCDSILHLELE